MSEKYKRRKKQLTREKRRILKRSYLVRLRLAGVSDAIIAYYSGRSDLGALSREVKLAEL